MLDLNRCLFLTSNTVSNNLFQKNEFQQKLNELSRIKPDNPDFETRKKNDDDFKKMQQMFEK